MQDRLTIIRPPAIGAALADAVRSASARRITVAPDDLPLLDARLACGDFDSVLMLLRDPAPASVLPLFVARYTMWTGDLHSAAAAWSTVLLSLEGVLANRADDPGLTGTATTAGADAALRRSTAVELARTATDLGDAHLAARLHGIARQIDSSLSMTTNADPDSAVICDVAFSVLGIEPDATRGRLRLRPRLDRFAELEAHHIRFADADVSLTAAHAGTTLSIHVRQESGSIPVTLLLEPFVNAPAAAWVDGIPADLKPRNESGGTIVPVQLVLDDARTLIVHAQDS